MSEWIKVFLKIGGVFIIFIILSLSASEVWGREGVEEGFAASMASVVEEIKASSQKDPKLKQNPKFRLGRFISLQSPNINHEPAIVDGFEKGLKGLLVAGDNLEAHIISGTYEIRSVKAGDKLKRFIDMSFSINAADGSELGRFDRKLEEPTEVAIISGLTVSFSSGDTEQSRQAEVSKAIEKPQFGLIPGTKSVVTTHGGEVYGVEILKRAGKSDSSTEKAVAPESEGGYAFIPLEEGDIFSIRLHNYNELNPVLAKIKIDGLDAINAFCVDKVVYSGYSVQKADKGPSKSTIPGWLKSAKIDKDNVLRFEVGKVGGGAASEKKLPPGGVGVITVEFYEPRDASRGRDTDTEVKAGEAIDVAIKVSNFVAAAKPSAIVSIRYNRNRGAQTPP